MLSWNSRSYRTRDGAVRLYRTIVLSSSARMRRAVVWMLEEMYYYHYLLYPSSYRVILISRHLRQRMLVGQLFCLVYVFVWLAWLAWLADTRNRPSLPLSCPPVCRVNVMSMPKCQTPINVHVKFVYRSSSRPRAWCESRRAGCITPGLWRGRCWWLVRLTG